MLRSSRNLDVAQHDDWRYEGCLDQEERRGVTKVGATKATAAATAVATATG